VRMIGAVALVGAYLAGMFTVVGSGGAPGPVAAAFVAMACGFLGGSNYDAFI
jgi:hypothetical protein